MVEGDNADLWHYLAQICGITWHRSAALPGTDLRHYLARLGRKSRCFSRRLEALARQVRLFVFCYDARQLFARKYPRLKAHLIRFSTCANLDTPT